MAKSWESFKKAPGETLWNFCKNTSRVGLQLLCFGKKTKFLHDLVEYNPAKINQTPAKITLPVSPDYKTKSFSSTRPRRLSSRAFMTEVLLCSRWEGCFIANPCGWKWKPPLGDSQDFTLHGLPVKSIDTKFERRGFCRNPKLFWHFRIPPPKT